MHQLKTWTGLRDAIEKVVAAEKEIEKSKAPYVDKDLNKLFEATDAAYVRDIDGNLLRKKTEEEITAQRERNIDIQTKIFNATKAGSEESIRAELELDRLQKGRLDYEERKQREIASLKQSLVNTDKQYVRDQGGNLLRSKTDTELDAQREKDIEQQRKILDSAKEGSKERLQAEVELDRLQAEQLKREEQSRQAMLQDIDRMSGSLTRMRETAQTAISANSAEGIRLQSRATMSGQDYQKATAENSKATVAGIEGMKTLLEQLYTNGTDISTQLSNIKSGTL